MANKSNPKRTFKSRSIQVYLTCKDCRIKCDEGIPVCQYCVKVNRECVQRDSSGALLSSTSSDATAANTPNTTPAQPLAAETTVDSLSVVAEYNNTSETAKTANTISNTILEPLSKYTEDEIDSTGYDHDIKNLVQSINKRDYAQTSIMDKKTAPKPKPAAPVLGGDKNVSNSTTISKPTNKDMGNNTKETSKPASSAKFISTLSLASTTTNRPPRPNFTPFKPITDWVPPRPTIIARTELCEVEKAELRAEEATRKTEKGTAKRQKRKGVEMMVANAKEAQLQTRARELGGI